MRRNLDFGDFIWSRMDSAHAISVQENNRFYTSAFLNARITPIWKNNSICSCISGNPGYLSVRECETRVRIQEQTGYGAVPMIKSLDRTGTWRTYSTADGLPGVRIEQIAEDSEGFLWFATWENGASRFDGDEFRNFTEQDGLAHHRVNTIFNDSRDRLWFGTSHGACWYDGAIFHHLECDGIAGRSVGSFCEDSEGRLWLGGHKNIGYCDGAVYHDVLPGIPRLTVPYSNDIIQDSRGHIWISAEYPIRFDGERFHRYDEKDGFPHAEMGYAVSRDLTGRVWLARVGHGDRLWYFADDTFHSVSVDLGGWLRRIQCDREGRMWICTLEEALYMDGDGFSSFTTADGLPHPSVSAVFQDREHHFWFATWGGVGRYDDSISVCEPELEMSGYKCEASQLVQDRQGAVWVGYSTPLLNNLEKSVFRFNGEHFAHIRTDDGVDIDNCFALHQDHNGYMWLGGINGLFRYDGERVERIHLADTLSDVSISAIAQDAHGRLLFGYRERTKKQQRENLLVSPMKLIVQHGERFHTVAVEERTRNRFSRIGPVINGCDGEIYFCLSGTSFSDPDKGFARWHPEDGLKYYGLDDGLIDTNINDLLLDRAGNLWVATHRGLCRFDGSAFQAFTTEHGLPNNFIRCLFEDRQGHLWIGTNSGVVHYDGRTFQRIQSPHIGPVCRILEDRAGTFWFGSLLGSIIRYRVRHVPPRIRLLQVIANRVFENLDDAIHSTSDQQVTFEYKGLGFSTHPRDMLYTYRLKGHDPDWQPPTRETRAHYRDLPTGEYTFQVRAIDRDLNYSDHVEARLTITSDPRIEAFTAILNRRGSREFVGHSPALRQFQNDLRKVAAADITVLIMGETGVGKGLAARALHALSPRCDGPFIEVSCGALPVALVDSELFGHEKGAFTSAVSHRLGRVELAEGGTLFLDEIGDVALETQVKLLRLLEEGTYERVGSSKSLTAWTRIVAATNRSLAELVGKGAFREDLFYRLNAFPLVLPPLRQRRADIPALAELFKHRMATHLGKEVDPLTPEVIEVLQDWAWPGNVRELEHTIQRAVVLCAGPRISVADLGPYGSRIKGTAANTEGPTVAVSHDREILPLEESERRHILAALEAANWRIKGSGGAATLLGLPPSTLYGKMKKLGIRNRV